MKNNTKKLLFLIIFILSFTFSFSQNNTPKAENGVLDLTKWNFNSDGKIKLSGEWEFYWSELYTPEDFKNTLKPDSYLNVPGGWSNLQIEGKNLPDTGFATYRLIILADSNVHQNLTIVFKEIITAYNVWVNGEKITSLGKVSTNSKTDFPVIRINKKTKSLQVGENEIIVQVSNYNNRRNGFVQAPIIGEYGQIYLMLLKSISFDLIVFGFLLVMSIYHFGLYIFRHRLLSALIFSLFLIIVSLRVLVTSNFLLSYFIESLSLSTIYFISYFTYYAAFPLMVLYIQKTFEEQKHKFVFNLLYVVSTIFILSLLLNSLKYIDLAIIYQAFSILYIIFTIYLLIKYTFQKKEGALILLLSLIVVSAAVINDILFMNNIINTGIYTPAGLFVLILGQSLTSINIFSTNDRKNIEISDTLEYQNKNLQQIVNNRTEETAQQNKLLEKQNIELDSLNEKLTKYFVAIEQSPLPIIITDNELNIEYLNPSFSTSYTDQGNLIGKQTKLLNFGTDSSKNYTSEWNELAAKEPWQGEFVSNNTTNTTISNVIISNVTDDNSNIINYIAIIQDITEYRETEKNLNEQNKSLVNVFGKLEVVHNEIVSSINYARKLQTALLPNRKILLDLFKDYLLIYKPKESVSGDFYYVNKIKDNLLFALGDCTGVGVHGAFMTVLSTSILHEISSLYNIETPSQILELLREKIKEIFKNFSSMPDDGLDIAVCVFDSSINELLYSGANVSLFVQENTEITEHKGVRNHIGFHTYEKEFTDTKIILSSNSKIFIASDGLFNQLGGEDFKPFGKSRFKELLIETTELDFIMQKNIVLQKISDWQNTQNQVDDITLLGLELLKNKPINEQIND
ncbi:MAG: SpoIIE family protein phosphatase [Bacteroidales bacterium]|nr:SpoIIE family protein phosphatase [Bacteroidales bacterium]